MLNVAYPPSIVPGKYEPKLGEKTGLYYWGRKVLKNHNFPFNDKKDEVWGPDGGVNCAACRTLRTPIIDEINKQGKFQGSSGLIYCGKKMKVKGLNQNGFCGPHIGYVCQDCKKIQN